MSKLTNQWIDLFRAGDYSDVDKGKFTEQDLDQIVNNYDPAGHEAFSAIGHPKKNETAPAYGWWSKLRRVGDLLQGQMGKVQPEFEEGIERQLWKKRSVGLVKDPDKGWLLHHVAWLGAQAPQIKGLADVKFENDNQESVEIDFSEENTMATEPNDTQIEGALTRFFAKFAPKPAEPAAKTFSEDDVKRIAGEAVKEALKAELDPLKTEFSEAQKRVANATTKQRAADAIAKLKSDGKWIPAFEKMGVPVIFEGLAEDVTLVEFGEADAASKKVPQVSRLDLAVHFFEGLKKIVPNDPIFSGQPSTVKVDTKGINESGRAPVDPNSVQLDRKVREFMETDKTLNYGDAMTKVIAKHPELAKAGGASVGEA